MKFFKQQWQSIGTVALILLVNGLIMMQLTGLSYASSNWESFAQSYSGSINGTVTDGGGNPLQGIDVDIYWFDNSTNSWFLIFEPVTNANGQYNIGGLITGTYRVGFSDYSNTYLSEYYDNAADLAGATDVSVTDGQATAGIDASLVESGGHINGTVTDSGGNPLPGIDVTTDKSSNIVQVSASSSPWLLNRSGSATTGADGKYAINNLPAGDYKVSFRDPNETYLRQYYTGTGSWNEATGVGVTAGQTTVNIDAQLIKPEQAEPPQAEVSGVYSWSDPHTGKISVWGGQDMTFTRTVTCSNGAPSQVKLKIGSKEFTMTAAGGDKYTVTAPGSDLPNSTSVISVGSTCNGSVETAEIGALYIDPSGYARDAQTNQPIAGATVTLYKDPNRVPDDTGPVDTEAECYTINSRPGGSSGAWDGLPAAVISSTQKADVTSGEFIPTVNPLTTGTDGYYRWDVTAGCWYVEVKAGKYTTKVSPVVGVVAGAEVTDLDFYLERNIFDIYLPLVMK